MVPAQALLVSRGQFCRRCLCAYNKGVAPIQRRNISRGHIQKTADAEAAWQIRAKEIEAGKVQNTFDMLVERGYVKDTAG
jgi:tyrosyl-tRNA synthetase